MTLKGQACTEKICKNVDVSVPVPAAKQGGSASIDLKSLVQVR